MQSSEVDWKGIGNHLYKRNQSEFQWQRKKYNRSQRRIWRIIDGIQNDFIDKLENIHRRMEKMEKEKVLQNDVKKLK